MDFTIKKYKQLLLALQKAQYEFQTFSESILYPKKNCIVLRHDVDLLPQNSLRFARIQHEYGIKGTYYFRAVPESWNEGIILEISSLGHEIGYHYECITTTKGNLEEGIKDFENNLSALRKIAPVNTICMHGSPMSKFDSKDLWRKYNYRDYGIIAEPYFDVNFKEVLYLTDTGRRWDGNKVSVRDKVNSGFDQSFNSTSQIIEAIQHQKLPEQIMFTFHPQRWNDSFLMWTKELIVQNIKNIIKRLLFVKNNQTKEVA